MVKKVVADKKRHGGQKTDAGWSKLVAAVETLATAVKKFVKNCRVMIEKLVTVVEKKVAADKKNCHGMVEKLVAAVKKIVAVDKEIVAAVKQFVAPRSKN